MAQASQSSLVLKTFHWVKMKNTGSKLKYIINKNLHTSYYVGEKYCSFQLKSLNVKPCLQANKIIFTALKNSQKIQPQRQRRHPDCCRIYTWTNVV